MLLKRFGDWKFPAIAGIISTPTLRPDGTILKDAGYDPATQLLLIDPPPMPEIPDNPTRNDALAALRLLKDLLAEFPFVDEVSLAVALSAQISTVCRGAYPIMPVHVVDAPAAGSGKSYLLSTVSWIATGQAMPVLGAGKSEEELGKAARRRGHYGAAADLHRQCRRRDRRRGDLPAHRAMASAGPHSRPDPDRQCRRARHLVLCQRQQHHRARGFLPPGGSLPSRFAERTPGAATVHSETR